MQNYNAQIRHKAIIYGKKLRKIYDYNFILNDIIREEDRLEFVCDIEIFSGVIEFPLLQEKEKIYISELEKEFKIIDVAKKPNGTCIYYTNYNEIIEDEKTIESLKNAKMKQEEYYKKINKKLHIKLNETNEILTKEREKINHIQNQNQNKRRWYQMQFGDNK